MSSTLFSVTASPRLRVRALECDYGDNQDESSSATSGLRGSVRRSSSCPVPAQPQSVLCGSTCTRGGGRSLCVFGNPRACTLGETTRPAIGHASEMWHHTRGCRVGSGLSAALHGNGTALAKWRCSGQVKTNVPGLASTERVPGQRTLPGKRPAGQVSGVLRNLPRHGNHTWTPAVFRRRLLDLTV